MKTYAIDSIKGGLVTSPRKTYTLESCVLSNGRQLDIKIAEGAKLIYVLSGEMDAEIEGRPFRLKQNNWINVPEGKKYSVKVYRSVVDCKFIVLTYLGNSNECKVMYGDLSDLKLKGNDVKYALFGQETGVMQGHSIVISDSGFAWQDTTVGEGFIYAVKGDIKVKFSLKEVLIPEGTAAFLPKNHKFRLHSDSNANTILVYTPISDSSVTEYTEWLKDTFGFLWNDGGVKF